MSRSAQRLVMAGIWALAAMTAIASVTGIVWRPALGLTYPLGALTVTLALVMVLLGEVSRPVKGVRHVITQAYSHPDGDGVYIIATADDGSSRRLHLRPDDEHEVWL